MKVNINTRGNDNKLEAIISLPSGSEGYLYLHFEADDKFFGTVEKTSDLTRLKKMIDKVLKHNKKVKETA